MKTTLESKNNKVNTITNNLTNEVNMKNTDKKTVSGNSAKESSQAVNNESHAVFGNNITDSTPVKGNSQKRKMAEKKYSSLENTFVDTLKECRQIQSEIESVEQIVKSKQIAIEAEDKKAEKFFRKLSAAELAGWKNKLMQLKRELKFKTKALKSCGDRYSKAAKKNASATKHQIKRFNKNIRLGKIAIKESDKIIELSDSIFGKLAQEKDVRLEHLGRIVNEHPQKMNSVWWGILKQELAGVKVGEELALDLLTASSSVRSKLAKRFTARLKQ